MCSSVNINDLEYDIILCPVDSLKLCIDVLGDLKAQFT